MHSDLLILACAISLGAQIYLTRAACAEEPVERLKYVITFLIAGLHRSGKQLKPFNPILGETYQGRYDDGTLLYCEQVMATSRPCAFIYLDFLTVRRLRRVQC